jgi:dihydropyrimidinase
MQVRGWPAVVMSRGEVVVEEGKLQVEPGRGEFLRCKPPARI